MDPSIFSFGIVFVLDRECCGGDPRAFGTDPDYDFDSAWRP